MLSTMFRGSVVRMLSGEGSKQCWEVGRALRSPAVLAAWRIGDGAFRYAKWSGDWRGREGHDVVNARFTLETSVSVCY